MSNNLFSRETVMNIVLLKYVGINSAAKYYAMNVGEKLRDVRCQITEHRLTPIRHSVHTDRFSVTGDSGHSDFSDIS
jgi:hypothetical protein